MAGQDYTIFRSLTAQRLHVNDFRITLKCAKTTLTFANAVLYTQNCFCVRQRSNIVEVSYSNYLAERAGLALGDDVPTETAERTGRSNRDVL